eukprot:923761-Heterocapsa_arctica.AAC.1
MADTSLATTLEQILVAFFGDANGVFWHMRLLLIHGGGGKWIAATPDHELEVIDITEYRVIPLESHERFADL